MSVKLTSNLQLVPQVWLTHYRHYSGGKNTLRYTLCCYMCPEIGTNSNEWVLLSGFTRRRRQNLEK
jgi:hypothetical protein